ncbi:MAG TPA: ribosome maturation factor RimM [Gemmatimonadaceae bacterium]|nr:ribosome maturation factor RimM [Gemmatimonadaceae bacterium]
MGSHAFAIVGLIRNAQGIRGEVVVEPLTDAPDAIFASGRRVFMGDADGDRGEKEEHLTVESVRPFKGGLMIKFSEVADRNAAELVRGRYLLAPFEELEPPREDEIYLHELQGMKVELDTGEAVGEVTSWYELPQGLTLDVATRKGSVLIPYRPEVVERVDADSRVVIVRSDLGLFD